MRRLLFKDGLYYMTMKFQVDNMSLDHQRV
jgi:hypothetical protein